MAAQQIFVLSIVPLDSSVVIFVCLFAFFRLIFSMFFCVCAGVFGHFFRLFNESSMFRRGEFCCDNILSIYMAVSPLCVDGWVVDSNLPVLSALFCFPGFTPLTISLNVNHAKTMWNKQQYAIQTNTIEIWPKLHIRIACLPLHRKKVFRYGCSIVLFAPQLSQCYSPTHN